MNTDSRPQAIDMTLYLNKMCLNKCKRYYEFWKPTQMQGYIYPANEYDIYGNQKPCKIRKEGI